MGLFSFMANAGETLSGAFYEFLHTGENPEDFSTLAPERQDELRKLRVENAINDFGAGGKIAVSVKGDTITLTGSVATQEQCEKLVLLAGNQAGIAHVDCRLDVQKPQTPSTFYTVCKGDTLAGIAQQHYGSSNYAQQLLSANQPMLRDAEALHPGQVLRIPAGLRS